MVQLYANQKTLFRPLLHVGDTKMFVGKAYNGRMTINISIN